jgi:carboxyl-terminal processing protease
MTAVRVLFAGLFAATFGLLCVSPAQAEGKIAERKAIPADVEKAAEDYADTILKAVQILHDDHIKKVAREQLVAWAIRGLYQRMGICEPSDIANRLRALRDPSREDLHALLKDARQRLGNNAKLAEFRDMDYALEGIFEQLEPQTKPQPLRETRIFCRTLLMSRSGIGVEICQDKDSGFLRVVTPIKGSPAHKAGIRAGDIITRITQEKDEGQPDRPRTISTKNLTVEGAEKCLLGAIGSKVKLTVYREDPSKPRKVVIARDWTRAETVVGVRRKADDGWDFTLDATNKIAYVRIKKFGRSTSHDLAWAMVECPRKGAQGLVLDLRGNPGGLIDSSFEIAEIFLERGLFVTVKSRSKNERIECEAGGPRSRIPLVCLTDSATGRASEMLAACLQDHHRAVLVGERSCGDADFQHILAIPHGDLQFTTMAFYRPNGKPLSKFVTSGKEGDDWGVRPDKGFVVKLTADERKQLAEQRRQVEIIAPRDRPLLSSKPAFRDRQLEKAVEYLRQHTRQARS